MSTFLAVLVSTFAGPLNAAERQRDDRDWKIWPHFLAAVTNLNQGATRLHVAKQFEQLNEEFPGSFYEAQAAEYARILRRMADEDAAFVQPTNIAALSTSEQARIALFRIRDRNALQWSDSGHCQIFGGLRNMTFYGYSMAQTNVHQRDAILDLGFNAVPVLIGALDDDRLTRSVGWSRRFAPARYVLRIGDGAIQALEIIAGESFYRPTTTSSYLLSEKPELQATVKKRVAEWWKKSEPMGEPAWLREKIKEARAYTKSTGYAGPVQDEERFLYRLVSLEGSKALQDIHDWQDNHGTGYRGSYYRLLLMASGVDEVMAAADPASDKFECGAALALLHTGRTTEQEYKATLYRGTLNVCRRTDPGPIPLNVHLLSDAKDPRCMLLLSGMVRRNRNSTYNSISLEAVGDAVLDKRMASQLLVAIAGTNQITSVCYNLNQVLGQPLGKPEWKVFEQAETKEKLVAICDERGIKPATLFPWDPDYQ